MRQGTIKQAAYPSAHFGMVSLSHLLEHLEQPEPVLSECFRVLTPGGVLYGEVPHSDGDPRDYGNDDHYWFYNPPALRYLLSCIGFREIVIRDGSKEPRLHNVPFLAFRATRHDPDA